MDIVCRSSLLVPTSLCVLFCSVDAETIRRHPGFGAKAVGRMSFQISLWLFHSFSHLWKEYANMHFVANSNFCNKHFSAVALNLFLNDVFTLDNGVWSCYSISICCFNDEHCIVWLLIVSCPGPLNIIYSLLYSCICPFNL